MKHPLQVLIDQYQTGQITEDVLRAEAAKLPEQEMKVFISVSVIVYKTVTVPVSILAEAAIDESGDVYNDTISPLLGGFDGWDDYHVGDEDHTWVDNEGKEIER